MDMFGTSHQHNSHLPSAEDFLPPKFVCTPEIEGILYMLSTIHWGFKNKEKEQMCPQLQNAVGTLHMVKASLEDW